MSSDDKSHCFFVVRPVQSAVLVKSAYMYKELIGNMDICSLKLEFLINVQPL